MHAVIATPLAAIAMLSGTSASSTLTGAGVAGSVQCAGVGRYCVATATSLGVFPSIPPPAADPNPVKSAKALVDECRTTFTPAYGDTYHGQKGGWYFAGCEPVLGSSAVADGPFLKFVPDSALGVPALTVALQARRQLVLPTPSIFSSPGPAADVPKVVNLPTWAWIDRPVWAPISATASAPGVSVTVTASPASLSWSWGDGTANRCQGPGTPFAQERSDPAAASPDCGHTYTTTSKAQRSLRFPVTATIHWRISWQATTGRSGSFPDMTSRASQAWPVEELDALNIPAE